MESILNINLLYAFIAGIGIGVGLYLGRFIKAHLLWIKGGIENGDDVLQNKELQITFFSILSAVMIVAVIIWHTQFPDIAYIGVFGGAGVLYSVNTLAEAYVKAKTGKKDNESKDEKEGEF